MPFAYYLIGPRKRYMLKFATLQEKHHWMDAMNSAIKKKLTEENAPGTKGDRQRRGGDSADVRRR